MRRTKGRVLTEDEREYLRQHSQNQRDERKAKDAGIEERITAIVQADTAKACHAQMKVYNLRSHVKARRVG